MYTEDESTRTNREWTKDYKRDREDACPGLGTITLTSSKNGHESNQVPCTDSTRRDLSREEGVPGGQGVTGKVLDSLRELKRSHLAFIDSHTQSLEAQLEKSAEYRNQINQSITSLEKEILEALDEVE